jgi:hypothetical protein
MTTTAHCCRGLGSKRQSPPPHSCTAVPYEGVPQRTPLASMGCPLSAMCFTTVSTNPVHALAGRHTCSWAASVLGMGRQYLPCTRTDEGWGVRTIARGGRVGCALTINGGAQHALKGRHRGVYLPLHQDAEASQGGVLVLSPRRVAHYTMQGVPCTCHDHGATAKHQPNKDMHKGTGQCWK